MQLNELIQRLTALRDQHSGEIDVDIALNHDDDGFCSKPIESIFDLTDECVPPTITLHGGDIEWAEGVSEIPARAISREIVAERYRQEMLGFTAEVDDQHVSGELASAAAAYAENAALSDEFYAVSLTAPKDASFQPHNWPFEPETFKPAERRFDLIRAAALIVAEIERLDRAEEKAAATGGEQA